MSAVIWVALGGALGSIARYGISGALNSDRHPWGTVTVNIVGSFALGVLIGLWGIADLAARRTGITVGLLGGFTTFSTFALDYVTLWEEGRSSAAVAMVAISVLAGIGAAIAGLAIGRSFST